MPLVVAWRLFVVLGHMLPLVLLLVGIVCCMLLCAFIKEKSSGKRQ